VTPRGAIPLAGAPELARLARRTLLVRVAAAVALVALALTAVLISRHPRVHEVRFLPKGSNGVVVLDVSASISSDTYARIGATLRDLASSRGRFGLVLFSDTAYEALPPGTPADMLRPLVRFFTLPPQRTPGVAPTFPDNPWTRSFTAGTRISTGLELARSILIDQRSTRPAVLLISDLDDDAGDLQAVHDIADAYRSEHIALDIVSLNAAPEDARIFRQFLRGAGSITQAHLPGHKTVAAGSARFPVWIAVVAVLIAVLLAGNELWCARLTWAAEPAPDGATG
jgi:hypothetical protein